MQFQTKYVASLLMLGGSVAYITFNSFEESISCLFLLLVQLHVRRVNKFAMDYITDTVYM